MNYARVLEAARRLPPDEQQRLLHELEELRAGAVDLSAVLLAVPALDPGVVDDMERAIEEGCERIDSRDE